MKLRDWRNQQKKTLREMADLLGIGQGANPSRRMQRVEIGESPIDTFLADKIIAVTDGQVSLGDLHDMRREFLSRDAEGDAA